MREGFRRIMVAIFAEGHVLIEGVPGTGKTLTATTLSEILDVSYERIQLTPDTKPKDIQLRVEIKGKYEFEFSPGPIYAQLLLTDEINRTPATTQSAILEPMEERQFTTPELGTVILPRPFINLSTVNPIEQEGVYPLPEAQRDRYLMKLFVEPATRAELVEIATTDAKTPVEKVMSADDIVEIQKLVQEVHIDESLVYKAAGLAELTWSEHSEIARGVFKSGVANRGPKYLVRAARALAAVNGRDYVVEMDIVKLIRDVLAHRLVFEEYDSSKYVDIFNKAIREIVLKVFPEMPQEEVYYATR